MFIIIIIIIIIITTVGHLLVNVIHGIVTLQGWSVNHSNSIWVYGHAMSKIKLLL